MKDLTLKLAHGVNFKIDTDNDTFDEDEGGRVRLVGFQESRETQRVALFVKDWREDPQRAVGMYPVFSSHHRRNGIYQLTIPVEAVEEGNERRDVKFTATLSVDVETWAAEYGISEEEVLADVRNYLNSALSDLNEMLHLKGAIK